MNALLVDDDWLARLELRRLLADHADITIVGEAVNADDAVTRLEDSSIDLVFLDIQMPGGSGFDVLERLERVPLVVFTTAFDEYAVRAFEVNAFDYLMKPVRPERLASVLDRTRTALTSARDTRPERPPLSTGAYSCVMASAAGSCCGPTSCCSRSKGTTRAPTSGAIDR